MLRFLAVSLLVRNPNLNFEMRSKVYMDSLNVQDQGVQMPRNGAHARTPQGRGMPHNAEIGRFDRNHLKNWIFVRDQGEAEIQSLGAP
jgi:hypothetical protein